jgi:tRNA threonylcarbamoyladenosine biosynthesis protein TsaB
MSLILNIDTATETASVCLAREGISLQLMVNDNQKDHAAWLHTAINGLLNGNNCLPGELKAVAVSIGPGSYTGLRAGLSAAKGLCYALNIPLITVSTLKMMAFAVQEEAIERICPLIDARRMEVFVAVYDKSMREITPPTALVIDENSFASLVSPGPVLFCGNGCKKLQPLLEQHHAACSETTADASHLAALSGLCFEKKEFAGLAYTEPFYIKEFYTPLRKT